MERFLPPLGSGCRRPRVPGIGRSSGFSPLLRSRRRGSVDARSGCKRSDRLKNTISTLVFKLDRSAADTYLPYTGYALNPQKSEKADLQFRRKQSLAANAKIMEAAGQTGMPIFLAVRLLGSGSLLSTVSPICGIRKPRPNGHNHFAGGSSSFEASKPPQGIAEFVGFLYLYKTPWKLRKPRLQATLRTVS
jgi:hypothetical protein